MSSTGAAPRAAVPVSSARAAASRKNGAKSRGPKTPEGKARAAQNALKHGLRVQKYVVLPEEDADEFAGLEAAMIAELAPVGALQVVLARRVAVAAWRLARADRLETELFAERRFGDGGLGLALIRDGNGTRSFETLLRYRGAAMAEFWRALRTLKALQAEPALATGPPWRRTPRRRIRRGAQHGHRSSIVRNRTNPSAPPSPAWITSCPSRPRAAAPCTRPQRPGCQKNPSRRRQSRRHPRRVDPRSTPGRTNPNRRLGATTDRQGHDPTSPTWSRGSRHPEPGQARP